MLQSFKFDLTPIRAVMIDGEPWFIATDVTFVLGLGNPRSSLGLLDEDEKGVHSMDTPGGTQQATIINESGLYSLILRSRRPEARPFRKWITSEVIPSIRKTGSYGLPPAPLALPSYPDALRQLASTIEEKDRLVQENAALIPKAEAFDALMESDGTYSVSATAKILNLGLGQTKLFALLRERGILMDRKRSGNENHNVPYQKYLDAHYFTVDTKAAPDGIHVSRTTRVTTRGLAWLQTRLTAHLALLTPSSPPVQPHMA